jgi:arylsulfatase A-like enzyme
MTMLTGLYPAQHGIDEDGLALASGIPLAAERLRAAGYQTVGLYCPGYVSEIYGFGRGFDVYRPHEEADEAGEHLREELAQLDRDRPFFLFLHLFDVHVGPFPKAGRAVYYSPPPYDDLFLADAAERLPEVDFKAFRKMRLSDEQIEALVALYDSGIRHMDSKLEEWFRALEQQGWLENTLVIVTSDHGESLAQRARKVQNHGRFFDEGIRVPLIVRTPRGPRTGRRVRQPVHLVDIVPTILEGVGLEHDPLLPGRSVLGDLPDERVLTGSKVPGEYVLRWPLKITRLRPDLNRQVNLELDPGELDPVFVPGETFDALRAQAFSDEHSFPPPLPFDKPPKGHRDTLEALGYASGDEQ